MRGLVDWWETTLLAILFLGFVIILWYLSMFPIVIVILFHYSLFFCSTCETYSNSENFDFLYRNKVILTETARQHGSLHEVSIIIKVGVFVQCTDVFTTLAPQVRKTPREFHIVFVDLVISNYQLSITENKDRNEERNNFRLFICANTR